MSKSYLQVMHMENFKWTLSNISSANCEEQIQLKATAVEYIPADTALILGGRVTVTVCSQGWLGLFVKLFIF